MLCFGIFVALLFTALAFLFIALAQQQAAGGAAGNAAAAGTAAVVDNTRFQYIRMAFILAPIWPIISLILAAVMMCAWPGAVV